MTCKNDQFGLTESDKKIRFRLLVLLGIQHIIGHIIVFPNAVNISGTATVFIHSPIPLTAVLSEY